MNTKYAVFVKKGSVSFIAQFVSLDDALMTCARAKSAGYKAEMKTNKGQESHG